MVGQWFELSVMRETIKPRSGFARGLSILPENLEKCGEGSVEG